MADLRYQYEGITPVKTNPGEYVSLQNAIIQETTPNTALFDTENTNSYGDIQIAT